MSHCIMLSCVLQILAMRGTTVVAGSRPGDEVDGLERLQQQYKERLSVVDLEVTSVASVQASTPRATWWSCIKYR